MKTDKKRVTIYFDQNLHKLLQLKSIETSASISSIVNDALKAELLGDADDLSAFDERAKEATVSYEKMVKDLKTNGKI